MAKQTPLYASHVALHAVMVEFAGWDMPLHYGSQIEEHLQVRKDAGIFDVSHMGIIDIQGPDSKEFLAKILANDIAKLHTPGFALYSCMLNDMAGIIDDLIVYFLEPDSYRLVVNAGCSAKDFAWLQQHSAGYTISLQSRTDLAMVAIQGPKAIKKFALTLDARDAGHAQHANEVLNLNKFGCIEYADLFIARTGYTGEDGIEVMLPALQAVEFWQKMIQVGIKPIGLGARDTLRLEAGLNLYGMDMDESITPYEANLDWTVALQPVRRDFIGRNALQMQDKNGIKRKLIPLVLLDRGVLRHGQDVYAHKQYANKEIIGHITSGTYAPTLERSIALARVNVPVASFYDIEIRHKPYVAQAVKLPFVKSGHANFVLTN